MQILLTGFGPFHNVISNPSERLVRQFAANPIAGHDLTPLVLPVSFERAPRMLASALLAGGRDGLPFDDILMLGLAGRSPHWRVERFGRNRDDAICDEDGFTPLPRVIVPGAPDLLPVTVSVDALVASLRQAGLPAEPSDSAGGYLCNHVLFRALYHQMQTGGRARIGFLHIPADETTFDPATNATALFSFNLHIRAVEAVIAVVSGQ